MTTTPTPPGTATSSSPTSPAAPAEIITALDAEGRLAPGWTVETATGMLAPLFRRTFLR